jgi:hypothetical protein
MPRVWDDEKWRRFVENDHATPCRVADSGRPSREPGAVRQHVRPGRQAAPSSPEPLSRLRLLERARRGGAPRELAAVATSASTRSRRSSPISIMTTNQRRPRHDRHPLRGLAPRLLRGSSSCWRWGSAVSPRAAMTAWNGLLRISSAGPPSCPVAVGHAGWIPTGSFRLEHRNCQPYVGGRQMRGRVQRMSPVPGCGAGRGTGDASGFSPHSLIAAPA